MKIAGICTSHGYYRGQECPKCKKRKVESSPYVFMRTERGYRTDMEMRDITMEQSIDRMSRSMHGNS